MRIEQLIYLRAVVEMHSFSEAAEILFISQGALSKSIKALEEELHVQLLLRRRDNISLTPIGTIVYEFIENILENYESLVNTTEAISPPQLIRVATFYYMSYCGIANAIVEFEHSNTGMIVETHECTHGQMISSLLCGVVDYCIGFSELWEKNEALAYIPLRTDHLGIVVGKKHPFHQKGSLSYDSLRNTKFCFMREDPEMFHFILNDFSSHRLYPNLTMSEVRLETIKEYILAGMRATVHVKSLLDSYFDPERFSQIELENAGTLTLTIAYNPRKLNAVSARFISSIAEHYGVRADDAELRMRTGAAPV